MRLCRISCLLVALMLAVTTSPLADHGVLVPTPETLEGGTIIAAEEAKKLWENQEAVFFDMRSPVNYGKGHIPGATALPYRQNSDKSRDFDAGADHFDLQQLPADPTRPIVFYSDGPFGWKSYKAAVLAIRAGYRNIMWFRGGFTDWPAKGYPVEY